MGAALVSEPHRSRADVVVEKEGLVAQVEKPVIRHYCPAMSPKPDHSQQPRQRWALSATIVLVALNLIAFCLQYTLLPKLTDPGYLELSPWGLQHGYVWQLLTYQFMHGGWTHLILNCWALFVFGRGVEWAMSKTRFVVLYFCSGIFGGLVQVLAGVLWPNYFDVPVVGASAGVFGVVASFAMLFPEEPLIMLLFFIIPAKMRAQSLLIFTLLLTGLGIAFPQSRLTLILGRNVAHCAHLGGILAGLAFTRFYFLRNFQPPPVAS
jgi:membrane associated rhomboid family serine protease